MTRVGALTADSESWVRAIDPRRCCDALYCEAPLFAVADGVDYADGSGQRVLDEVLRLLRRTVARRGLRAALHAANWATWYADPATGRSSATVTIARLAHDHLVIGHVGDSRAYLVRATSVRQLTVDHLASASDGAIRRAGRLGSRQADARIDVVKVRARPGDKVLLCTDGLWRGFEEQRLSDLVVGELGAASARLYELADAAEEDASAVLIQLRE